VVLVRGCFLTFPPGKLPFGVAVPLPLPVPLSIGVVDSSMTRFAKVPLFIVVGAAVAVAVTTAAPFSPVLRFFVGTSGSDSESELELELDVDDEEEEDELESESESESLLELEELELLLPDVAVTLTFPVSFSNFLTLLPDEPLLELFPEDDFLESEAEDASESESESESDVSVC